MKTRSGPGILVLGCGYWGANHIRVWHELGHLRGVCDVDRGRVQAVGVEYPDLDLHTDIDEALARNDVQGIVIATPATTHAELALRAIAAGKDVFVEKPMATDLADARKMQDEASRKSAVLLVGHVLEYHPVVLKLRELIEQGVLGRILYVYSHRLNFGKVRTEESALWSFAPHDLALLFRLVGADPVRISCSGGAYLDDEVADVTLMTLDFPNATQAHIFVSWLHPFKEHRFVVVGDRQMAVFDDTADWPNKLTLYAHTVKWVGGRVPVAERANGVAVSLVQAEPLRAECLEFVSCIETRRTPLTDGTSGLRVLQALDRADRSLRQNGVPVPFGEPVEAAVFVHPTSEVSPSATIGAGTRVWHYSHVMDEASIGVDCTLGQNVFIGKRVKVGDRVKIQNNVSVFEGVELEDGVFCGPSAVFTNVMNPRAEIERKNDFLPTVIRRGATLGANTTIVCGVTVGRFAFVAAGAVVTSDVPDYALVVGVPARVVGWMCECGEKLHDGGEGVRCERCGLEYSGLPPTSSLPASSV